MKAILSALLLALAVCACKTAYQTVEPEAPAPSELAEEERAAVEQQAKIDLSFAYNDYNQGNYTSAKDYFLKAYGGHHAFDEDYKLKFYKQFKKWATCYSNLGQPDSARIILEMAVEKLPDSWYEHRTLGLLLARMDDEQGAFEQYRICVDLKDDDWESHRDIKDILKSRAQASGAMEDWNAVLEALDKLIELRSEDLSFAQEKDKILAANYDPVEIINSLRENVEKFPDNHQFREKLASALVDFATQETYREALGHLDRLLAVSPEKAAYYNQKATALEGLDRGPEAVRVLFRLVELEPARPELPVRVGQLYLDLGNLRKARHWAARARRGFPGYGKGFILMAKVYEAAVDECAESELRFDDKLVYEMAAKEYDKVRDPAFRSLARQRRQSLEEVLPTAEDRFFNKNERPEKECYQWLFE